MAVSVPPGGRNDLRALSGDGIAFSGSHDGGFAPGDLSDADTAVCRVCHYLNQYF